MILRPLTSLGRQVNTKWLITRVALAGHRPTCPATKGGYKGRGDKGGSGRVGSGTVGSGSVGSSSVGLGFKRAERSGKCRLVWFPEEWFTFFYAKTGVSGFYLLLIGIANYCISKEIYVMEHEYYTGLSIGIMLWVAVKKLGPGLASSLDKQVDELTESWYEGRKKDTAMYESIVRSCQLAQKQAQGQKILMDAKKENILMQLEAIYRERAIFAYRTVKGRLDYHLKVYQAAARIEQKWMIGWILQNVMKSITPEFEASALNRAIKEIEEVASRA